MGSKYTTLATSGYNSSPPADDGSQVAANLIAWATHKTKLTDPIKTLADAINTALVTAFDYSVRSITASDSTAATDHMKTVEIASTVSTTVSVALGDASTMTTNYLVRVRNSSTISQVIARVTGADTIDGVAANVIIPSKSAVMFSTNAAGNGYITVATASTVGLPAKHISGLTYSNNGSDATNDIDIAAGKARDATDTVDIVLAATLTKQSDVAWAVGSGNGGLDTGAVGNSDYYIWLIKRSDSGVVDALYSLSSTAPTMPTSYDYKRLIGWFKRVGGTIVAFHTYEAEGGGLEMNWDVPTLDVNLANTLTTARRTDAVKVPLNFSTTAHLNVVISDAAITLNWICCPDQTDAAPSSTATPLNNARNVVAGVAQSFQMYVRTSATGTIAARSDTATVDLYAVSTMGFRWARRA